MKNAKTHHRSPPIGVLAEETGMRTGGEQYRSLETTLRVAAAPA